MLDVGECSCRNVCEAKVEMDAMMNVALVRGRAMWQHQRSRCQGGLWQSTQQVPYLALDPVLTRAKVTSEMSCVPESIVSQSARGGMTKASVRETFLVPPPPPPLSGCGPAVLGWRKALRKSSSLTGNGK